MAHIRFPTASTSVLGGVKIDGTTITIASGVISAAPSGLALPKTVSGTVTSGGIPAFTSTTNMASSGLLAANALMVGGGAGVAPSTVTTNSTALTALGVAPNASGGLATAAAPLTASTGGTMTGAFGYYICTTTCSITLPDAQRAGFQFCVRNDSTVVTVITILAISTVQFEKTTYNGYGTVSTGKMTSGGALGDKICLIGRDATHYLIGSFVGVWTNT